MPLLNTTDKPNGHQKVRESDCHLGPQAVPALFEDSVYS